MEGKDPTEEEVKFIEEDDIVEEPVRNEDTG